MARWRFRQHSDAGAAAVELALLLPLLMAILLGTIGFGRAFHTKLELSNAAQEGARLMVFQVGATAADARNQTVAAASVVPPLTAADVAVTGSCSGSPVNVTVAASRAVTFDYVLGTFSRTVTGRAVMRCPG